MEINRPLTLALIALIVFAWFGSRPVNHDRAKHREEKRGHQQ